MKKIIYFLTVVVIISFKANSQKSNSQLNNFLSSPEYSRISNESVFGFGAIDLNYDNFVPLEMVVNNGAVVNLDIQNMPDVIRSKYSYLLKKKDLGNPIYKSGSESRTTTTHHCDANGNGNVTFGECFSCYSAACANNQQCAILCAIVNTGGVWTVGIPACTASMAATCVWIAIRY